MVSLTLYTNYMVSE